MSRTADGVPHPAQQRVDSRRVRWWAAVVALFGALTWSYWPTIVSLIRDWKNDENYSVGQLVPLAAVYLVWHERHALRKCRMAPCWWGIGVILLAQAARTAGLTLVYESAERYSMVLTIIGLVLLVAGWQIFHRVRWILLFLFLMVPLPGQIHNSISGPLQHLASIGAEATLELCGLTVIREGNILILNDEVSVAVAEACSGLRMLTAFVVVAATLAYVVNRPPWQKAVLVISSVAVAIICNLFRLVVTAFLFLVASSEFAATFFHDFAGLTMMPLAVLLLWGELWIMSKLVVHDEAP